MGCDAVPSERLCAITYFNPRTHMGCDVKANIDGFTKDTISIHAPTWGATTVAKELAGVMNISIHAPTWGATRLCDHTAFDLFYFNPRTHMGCD